MFTPAGHLFRIDQMPEHFKEVFIISGYRHPRSTVKQCILSIFQANNETFNFWTHFLPALYYCWRMWQEWANLNPIEDMYFWPMHIYMITLFIFPLTSAAAHIFNALSDEARHICFFIDYGALSIYSLGVAAAYRAYIFPKDMLGTTFADIYLHIAALNALFSLLLSCKTRFMENGPWKKAFRFTAFALPYTFDTIPMLHRIFFCEPDDCHSEAVYLHMRHFFLAFMSAFLYTTHIPERLSPGSFDIVGHSHQLFHIFTILGSYDQLSGLMSDMHERKAYLKLSGNLPPVQTVFSLVSGVAVVNIIVLLFYVWKVVKCMQRRERNNAAAKKVMRLKKN